MALWLWPPQPEQSEEAGSARERLAGMAGTSSAFYDVDSDGYGFKSRENIKAMAPTDAKEVEKALKEKSRYVCCGNIFMNTQHVFGLLPQSNRQCAWCLFGRCFALLR